MGKLSDKTQGLRQSGIRAASVRCAQVGGINLGQGVCDLPIEESIKQGAYQAIDADKSLYSACEGALPLRKALVDKVRNFNRIDIEDEKEIIITHGSTGAFVSAVNTLFNPGDEVILFEPFYGYHKNILALHGVDVKVTSIGLKDYAIDFDHLKTLITDKTKGMVICTPNNPSGKVFTEHELLTLGELANQHDLFVITDEIYEYITYPGHMHVSLASLENFKQRTVTISGFSKTYNMTGWRLGYAVAPREIIEKMALVQDLLYVCPATPLQHAVLAALALPNDYYQQMSEGYLRKRDYVVAKLRELGFQLTDPQGAYYLLADVSALGFEYGQQAVDALLEKAKVATVAGDAFYQQAGGPGKKIIRLCYALDEKALHVAMGQLEQALVPVAN